MAAQSKSKTAPRLLRPVLARPYLFTSVAFGVGLYLATAPWVARGITRALLGWDGGVLLFLCLTFFFMSNAQSERMKRRALEHDEGSHLIFVATILASIASICALVAELSEAKTHTGAELRVALAAGTVVLSWLFVQIVFAVHYAHIYYRAEESGEPKGGLEFGDEGEPDYWDFVHFSIVMGATAQTADITFTSREMRRIGTIHTLVAFGFNTAILATMINLAANFI